MEFLWRIYRRLFKKRRKSPFSGLTAFRFVDHKQCNQATMIAANNHIRIVVLGNYTLIFHKKYKKYFKQFRFRKEKVLDPWNMTPEEEKTFYRVRAER